MAINFNKVFQRIKNTEDRAADRITAFSGTMTFLAIHAVWFTLWISANTGIFGKKYEFDNFPFGLLTLVVSLEAIFLSTFVMISQNRESKTASIRNHLEYLNNVQEEIEVSLVMKALERIADKQGVDVSDLVEEVEKVRQDTEEKVKLFASGGSTA